MTVHTTTGPISLRVPCFQVYRPFAPSQGTADWVADLELDGAIALGRASANAAPLRVLVLYGSLRQRSFSKLLAYEFARRAAGGRGRVKLLSADVYASPTPVNSTISASNTHKIVGRSRARRQG